MEEIKIYGRGGQGAVTAAQILAAAAFKDGLWAQTFPQFGAERRGAPVIAFIRLAKGPIPVRSKVYAPDRAVVMDFNLFKMLDPLADLKAEGLALLNYPDSGPPLEDSFKNKAGRLFAVDATRLAHEIYGPTTIPITNIIILGAYCAATQSVSQQPVSLKSVEATLPEFFPGPKLDQNLRAARQGYEGLRRVR